VLKILILPLNSPHMEDFQTQVLYFWKKIIRQAKSSLFVVLYRVHELPKRPLLLLLRVSRSEILHVREIGCSNCRNC